MVFVETKKCLVIKKHVQHPRIKMQCLNEARFRYGAFHGPTRSESVDIDVHCMIPIGYRTTIPVTQILDLEFTVYHRIPAASVYVYY